MSGGSLSRSQVERRWEQLKGERSSWVAHWREISRYVNPRSGRFLASDVNNGEKRHNDIYDSTATRALRVLGAGLMSGATSPARPWFRLSTPDPDLVKHAPVKLWLNDVTRDMLAVFSKSNTYRSLHTIYEEMGAYGTAASLIADDYRFGIRNYPLTAGEYCLGTDFNGDVCTLYREFQKQVGQIVHEFGRENCSNAVKNLYDRGSLDSWVTLIHAIEPRSDRDTSKRDAINMPWRSVYFEAGQDSETTLRESGFRNFNALCPRWNLSSGDIYGNSPAMESLGDIKQLQHQQLRKAKAIDYQTEPPLQVPSALKNRGVNRLPGGITYVDTTSPGNSVQTLFNVQLNLQHLLLDVQDVRQRINSTFYTDLFLMLAGQSLSNTTAAEIAERHEEKLLMLGPVMERVHNELLQRVIDATFSRLITTGAVPPPPEELQGQDLSVEFVSVLAQAQRAVATNGVDRFAGNLGQIAQFKPDVLDKFDADYWADSYSDMLGVDPELVVPSDKVALIRNQRAKAQQQQAQMEQVAQASQAARNLGATPTGGRNALTDIMQNLTGYGG